MQVIAFYKDAADYDSFIKKIINKDMHSDIIHHKSQKKLIIDITIGSEDDAEGFFIAERFRGRKLVIDA